MGFVIFRLMKTTIFSSLAFIAVSAAFAQAPSMITLQTETSSAVLSLHGGKIMSFKTGGEELLWSPKAWSNDEGKWCHGGIPLCWPWFGRSGSDTNVMHGFAWRSKFEVRSKKSSPVRSELVLGIVSSDVTRREWAHEFDLEYTVVLTDRLSLRLRTKNTGKEPFAITAGFHPYFFIGDRDRTIVTGTDGMSYCDSRVGMNFDRVWKGDLKLLDAFDHVFVEPRSAAIHKIVDPLLDRCVSVVSTGAKRLVVWNPGTANESDNPAPGNLATGDWRHFVCVEPAILWKEAAVEVQPGAVHELMAEISLVKGGN